MQHLRQGMTCPGKIRKQSGTVIREITDRLDECARDSSRGAGMCNGCALHVDEVCVCRKTGSFLDIEQGGCAGE